MRFLRQIHTRNFILGSLWITLNYVAGARWWACGWTRETRGGPRRGCWLAVGHVWLGVLF